MAAPVLVASLLAFAAGFAAQRGTICGVQAVRDGLERNDWRRFLAFGECAAWVLFLIIALDALRIAPIPTPPEGQLGGVPLLGAAVFGIGAVVNRACAFGTVARLGSGQTSYLALFPGFLLGAHAALPWAGALSVAMPGPLSDPAVRAAAGAGVTVFVALRLAHAARSARAAPRVLRGSDWPPGLSMAVIAGVNAPLAMLVVAWPYTGLLIDLVAMSDREIVPRLLLATVFLAGAVVGGASGGSFRLRAPGAAGLARSFIGGALMGAGAALIPGGNDLLVLRGLPTLALHAATSYAVMTLAIFGAVALERRLLPRT